MAKLVEAYRCEHCGQFVREKKYLVQQHELRCFQNPNNKACASCKHIREFTGDGWQCNREIFIEQRRINCKSWEAAMQITIKRMAEIISELHVVRDGKLSDPEQELLSDYHLGMITAALDILLEVQREVEEEST